jgi:hypothetical protein
VLTTSCASLISMKCAFSIPAREPSALSDPVASMWTVKFPAPESPENVSVSLMRAPLS